VFEVVEEVLCYMNGLNKAEMILARVVCTSGLQSRDAIQQDLTVSSVGVARRLMDVVAALEVMQYVKTKLVSLF
jgi:hypothetical protein